jgi:hypothetical protein
LVTGLTLGSTYNFKVQSRNTFGYSDFSTVLTVLAAQVPSQPAAPSTTFLTNTVQISWSPPATGGSAITGYYIYIRESDGVSYSLELQDCDGSLKAIIDNASCTVQVDTLLAAPFNLAYGSSIYATVSAYN